MKVARINLTDISIGSGGKGGGEAKYRAKLMSPLPWVILTSILINAMTDYSFTSFQLSKFLLISAQFMIKDNVNIRLSENKIQNVIHITQLPLNTTLLSTWRNHQNNVRQYESLYPRMAFDHIIYFHFIFTFILYKERYANGVIKQRHTLVTRGSSSRGERACVRNHAARESIGHFYLKGQDGCRDGGGRR